MRFIPPLPGHTGLALLFVTLLAASGARAAEPDSDDPLILGFFPLTSTVSLFQRFAPLADYLGERLGREVVLETARDFPTFFRRTQDRRYDIVVTAPHFAVEAVDSGRYRIRATLVKDVQQLVVVRKDSAITTVTDLAGKRVATPPARALITMMGEAHLTEAGLGDDNRPVYMAFVSHNAANEAVVAGLADAAIASSNVVGKAVERGAPLRVISRGLKLPNMATMVASDLPPALGDAVQAALVGMRDDPAGRRALKHIGFPGYRAVGAADYEPVRPYAYRHSYGEAPGADR